MAGGRWARPSLALVLLVLGASMLAVAAETARPGGEGSLPPAANPDPGSIAPAESSSREPLPQPSGRRSPSSGPAAPAIAHPGR